MAKLLVEISHEFEAGPIRGLRDGALEPLSATRIAEIVSTGLGTDFSLDVVFRDASEGNLWGQVDIFKKASRKSDVFEWEIDAGSSRVRVRARAQMESLKLRAGVPERIKNLGENFEIRLRGFNYKGGKWSGFEAPIVGHNEEGDFEKWYKLTNWLIK
jgi:hypothetical protein